jgi:hypothetical protein
VIKDSSWASSCIINRQTVQRSPRTVSQRAEHVRRREPLLIVDRGQHVGNVEFGECAHDLAREAAGVSGFEFTN